MVVRRLSVAKGGFIGSYSENFKTSQLQVQLDLGAQVMPLLLSAGISLRSVFLGAGFILQVSFSHRVTTLVMPSSFRMTSYKQKS